jgi:hypothetical protein
MNDRPIHPTLGQPLSGAARKWSGMTFRPYPNPLVRGDNLWASDDGRVEIRHRSPYHQTYVCVIDGKAVRSSGDATKLRFFHSQLNAAEYAAKALANAAEYGKP